MSILSIPTDLPLDGVVAGNAEFAQRGSKSKTSVERDQLWAILSRPKGRRMSINVVDRLLATFGSYARVLSASPVDLARYGGLSGEAVQAIVTVRTAAMHLIKTEIESRPLLSSMPMVENYLIAAMSRMPREQFRGLFLSSRYRLISDEVLSEGDETHAPASTRQVFSLALKLGALGLILVHNHPSGDPRPSLVDIETTKHLVRAGNMLGITVHDHIIVGTERVFSFRDHAIMPKLHRQCAAQWKLENADR